MTAIIYGSSLGNTGNAAALIAEKINGSETIDVSDIDKDTFSKYDTLLLGSSTWGIGDLQDDWEDKISLLQNADLSGKRIGFFGCGDQESYPDSFANALGTLYEAVKSGSAELIGSWPTAGYSFADSTAVVDGRFVGLVLDEDNQPELTGERITEWVKSLG